MYGAGYWKIPLQIANLVVCMQSCPNMLSVSDSPEHNLINPMRMKKLIFFFCLSLPWMVTAQSKVSIDVLGSFEVSNRHLSNTSDDEFAIAIFDKREQEEGPKPNYRTGLNVSIRMSEKLWLKSGFRFASVGYKSKTQYDLVYPDEYDPVTGEPIFQPALPREVRYTYNYWFLEMPVMARWIFSEKKFVPYAEFGFSGIYYLTTRTRYTTEHENLVYRLESPVNSIYQVTANLGVGINVYLGPMSSMFIQPNFRYHLSSTAQAPLREHLFNFGTEIGYRVFLGKRDKSDTKEGK